MRFHFRYFLSFWVHTMAAGASIFLWELCSVLVNQRVIESEIGRSESVTVVDEIHVIAMLFIFAMAIASIYSQIVFDQDRKVEAARFDKRALWVTLISFVLLNSFLIFRAATRG